MDTKPILQRRKLSQRVMQSLLRVRQLIGSRVGFKPTHLAPRTTGDGGGCRILACPRSLLSKVNMPRAAET